MQIEKTLRLKQLKDLAAQYIRDNREMQDDVDGLINKKRQDVEDSRLAILKSYSNIYIQLRFCKEFVEIDLNNVVDLLQDAVVVKKELIDSENTEIKSLGNDRVEVMKSNIERRCEVDNHKYDVLTKDLEIENDIIESMAITRMKVTKKL